MFLYFLSFLFVGFYAVFQWLTSFLGFIDPFISQFVGNGFIVRPNAFSYEPSFYVLNIAPFVSFIFFSFITSSQQIELFDGFFKKNSFLFFLGNFFLLVSMTTSSLLFYLFLFFLLFLFKNIYNLKKIIIKIVSLYSFLIFFFKVLPSNISFFFLKFFFQPVNSLESFSDRFSGIKVCMKIWLKNPILGIGLGNIPSYCYEEFLLGNREMLYRYTSMIKEKNFLKVFEPSNVFTELLASLGLVGLFSFSFFFLTILKSFFLAYKKRPMFSLNLIFSIFIMIFLLQINQGLFRTYVWVHLGIVFSLLENVYNEDLVIDHPSIIS